MRINSTLILVLVLSSLSCQPKRVLNLPTTDLSKAPLVPMVREVSSTGSGFVLDMFTDLNIQSENEQFHQVGNYLVNKIKKRTSVDINETTKAYTHIIIEEIEGFENPEAYQLSISEDSIRLSSSDPRGAFLGIQTIRQLIPFQSNDTLTSNPVWVIPTGHIEDEPQFEYRGTMLDVARHFFSVEDVKKYLDLLAYYKINKFHMHLTDDQGWRIEIKSWPKLTEVGSVTGVGGGPGGFYTQEEYKEIVAYAADRFITVIPEVDMPGHTNSASLAYPFLNGNGKEIKQETSMVVGYSTFDTRKDTVYQFIDDVIREISALSPGPYFHIGGDESHVTEKDDYIYFVNRVEKIVQKYDKQMVGWDEVATADLSASSVTQWWNHKKNAQLGIDKGMKLIVSLAQKAYLDMRYDKNSKYGLGWAGEIPVDTAYNWSPIAEFDKEHILGVEAPLWGETIRTIEELEYLAFPRVIGYAELGWTPDEKRDWDNYKIRLAYQNEFLKANNVNFYPSPLIDWERKQDQSDLKLK